jgi:L-malate glycosyltransferase
MRKLCLLANANSIHTQKWIEYFSTLNYVIDLISLTETDYNYKRNVRVHFIKTSSSNKLSYFLLISKVRKLVDIIKPDILHSHYASSYGMLGRMCNYHPFVVSVWGSDVYEFPVNNPFNKTLLKYILNGADAVCSTSEDMKSVTERYYKGSIRITPFGVDTKHFRQENPVFNKDCITVGVTKGLEKIYGINYLIEGFSEVLKTVNNKDIRLLVIGDGTERENLINLCVNLGIKHKVDFIGSVSNEYMVHYINKMDIVCIPSLSESFGVSAIEAEACERPVITSNIGGLKEVVINNKTGFLIESKNSNEIADKIKLLINNIELAKQLGKNGRRFVVNRFSWNNNTRIMHGLYDELTKKISD